MCLDQIPLTNQSYHQIRMIHHREFNHIVLEKQKHQETSMGFIKTLSATSTSQNISLQYCKLVRKEQFCHGLSLSHNSQFDEYRLDFLHIYNAKTAMEIAKSLFILARWLEPFRFSSVARPTGWVNSGHSSFWKSSAWLFKSSNDLARLTRLFVASSILMKQRNTASYW